MGAATSVDLLLPARHADPRTVQADRANRVDRLADRLADPMPRALAQPPVVRAAHHAPSVVAARPPLQRPQADLVQAEHPGVLRLRSRSCASSVIFARRRSVSGTSPGSYCGRGSPRPGRSGSPLRKPVSTSRRCASRSSRSRWCCSLRSFQVAGCRPWAAAGSRGSDLVETRQSRWCINAAIVVCRVRPSDPPTERSSFRPGGCVRRSRSASTIR